VIFYVKISPFSFFDSLTIDGVFVCLVSLFYYFKLLLIFRLYIIVVDIKVIICILK